MSGGTWDGYTDYGPGEPLPREVARLFPPATTTAATGHQQQEKTSVVYPGEGQGKRKRKPKPAAAS
jgi:hypothetical protein